MRSAMVSHRKLTTTNWEISSILIIAVSWSSYRYRRSCWRTQRQPPGHLAFIWSKLERWKSSTSGCLVSWRQIKKKYCFEVSSSHILHNNNKSFLNWIVMCNEKWIVISQPVMIKAVVGPRKSCKPLAKAKHAPKKVMATVWCSAACLTHYSFLNPGEIMPSEKYAQQIHEMHQTLQWLQPALVTRKGSLLLHISAQPHILQPMLQRLSELSCEILPHPPYSPDFWPNDHHFFNHLNNFLQGKCFHNQQEAENAFQEFVLKHGFLHYRNKHLFLIGKNLLIVMVPILINKDIFEPSYNDLKFMVRNCNYVCANLIIWQ